MMMETYCDGMMQHEEDTSLLLELLAPRSSKDVPNATAVCSTGCSVSTHNQLAKLTSHSASQHAKRPRLSKLMLRNDSLASLTAILSPSPLLAMDDLSAGADSFHSNTSPSDSDSGSHDESYMSFSSFLNIALLSPMAMPTHQEPTLDTALLMSEPSPNETMPQTDQFKPLSDDSSFSFMAPNTSLFSTFRAFPAKTVVNAVATGTNHQLGSFSQASTNKRERHRQVERRRRERINNAVETLRGILTSQSQLTPHMVREMQTKTKCQVVRETVMYLKELAAQSTRASLKTADSSDPLPSPSL